MAELPIIIDATKAKSGSDTVVKALQAMETSSLRSAQKMDEFNRRLMFMGELGKAQVIAMQSMSRSLQGLSQTLIANQTAWQQQLEAILASKTATEKAVPPIEAVEEKTSKLGEALKGVASQALAFAGAFLGFQGLTRAAALLAEFEERMLSIQATTRSSGAELAQMTEVVRELGATTRFSAAQAAEGLLNLARNGFTAAEAMKALPATLNLALVASLDLGQSADIVSNILVQFGLRANSTARAVDDLAIVANASAATVSELAEALKYAGPVSGALGMSLEETVALLGALGNAGLKASIAGTAIRGMFGDLLQPTETAKNAIAAMGLSLDDLNPAAANLTTIFSRLKEAGFDASDALAIFGRHQAAAALVLANSVGTVSDLVDKQKQLGGEAERIARIVDSGVTGAWKALISALQEVILKAGESGLTAVLKVMLQTLTHIVRGIGGVKGAFEEMGPILGILTQGLKAVLFLLVAMAAQATITFFYSLAKAIQTTAGAMTLLSTLAKVNPFVLAATAVLTLADAMGVFRSKTEGATGSFSNFNSEASAVVDQLDRIGAARARAAQVNDERGRLKALEDEAQALRDLEVNLIGLRKKQQEDYQRRASSKDDAPLVATFGASRGRVGVDDDLANKLIAQGINPLYRSAGPFTRGQGAVSSFDVEASLTALRRRGNQAQQNAESLRQLIEQKEKEERVSQEVVANRKKAAEALSTAGGDLSFQSSVAGLDDLSRAVAEYQRNLMHVAQEGNLLDKTLPKEQVEATQNQIALLTEQFRALQQAQQEAKFVEEFDALIERLRTETELLKLSNDERAIAIELQRAEEAAKRNGVLLTKEEYELVRRLAEEREKVKKDKQDEIELGKQETRDMRKAAKLAEKEAREAERAGPAPTDIQSAVLLSSQFTGVAESFRLNREPLVAIQVNTKKMAELLDRVERNTRGGARSVNLRVGSGVR